MGGNWETLQEEHTIKAFALISCKSLELIPNPTPSSSAQLSHT
jgi:hypothetical protein